MTFTEFENIAHKAFSQPLPGSSAHHLLAPASRGSENLDQLDHSKINTAGVMALFFQQNNLPHLVLIERATSRGVHSGQIAFPGGRREIDDLDFKHTALRETEEEIGLPANDIEVLGGFSPLYIPPSNFLVHPFVGLYHQAPTFIPQPSEVAQVIPIDFNLLIHDSAIVEQAIKVRGFNMTVPTFLINGITIWGATAMMLSELRHMIKSAR